jgi:hypothetical protein
VTAPVTVLFVMGSARSGSTILANVLGQAPGFFSAGEIRFLWERLRQGRRCGCGRPVSACELWGPVVDDQIADAPATAEEMVRWDHSILRLGHTASLTRRRPEPGSDLARYAAALGAVFASVARRTGAQVVIDSSKRPSNGAVVRWVSGVEVRYLHLVRDARAVAFSRRQRKSNPDREGGGEMAVSSPAESSLHWAASNAAADLVRAHARGRSLLLRYEDFVRDPGAALHRIGRLVGIDVDPGSLVRDGRVQMGANHTVSGNPARFVTGPVELRADERWIRSMPPIDRRLVTALTGPLLLRYGYPLRGARS